MSHPPQAITDSELAKREARSSFVTRLFLLSGILLLGAVLVTQLVTTVLIRHQQVSSVKTNEQTNENTATLKTLADQILSCTTPTGKCYRQGQAQTGQAVASINQVVIYAVACSKVVPNQGERTFTEIQSCVEARLKAASQ